MPFHKAVIREVELINNYIKFICVATTFDRSKHKTETEMNITYDTIDIVDLN